MNYASLFDQAKGKDQILRTRVSERENAARREEQSLQTRIHIVETLNNENT